MKEQILPHFHSHADGWIFPGNTVYPHESFCRFNDCEIVDEYEDAGKPRKSIEGRNEFNHYF